MTGVNPGQQATQGLKVSEDKGAAFAITSGNG